MGSITHQKVIDTALNPDWDQAKIDTVIAAGELAPGTTPADIALNSDFNDEHDFDLAVADITGLQDALDDKTDATVVPDTAPGAGQILVGNAGGTAYAKASMSGDATLASTGALTIANSAVTLAKIANAAANAKLLGSGAAGSGAAYSEITLGTNLSISGTTLNATGGSGSGNVDYGYPGLALSSSTTTQTIAVTLAAGNNDVYTVPAGTRAFIGALTLTQTSGGTLVVYGAVKNSGTYYRVGSNQNFSTGSVATVAFGSGTSVPPFIYEAGEAIALNATGALTGFAHIVEFPDTDPLRSARVLAPAMGDNTVYTGAGGGAFLIATAIQPAAYSGGNYHVANGTVGAVNVFLKYTVGATTLSFGVVSFNANARSQGACPMAIASGDVLIVNCASAMANSVAWVNVVERP
jgi:hypothetical protein